MDDLQVAALMAATLIASDPNYGEFDNVIVDRFHDIRNARKALVAEGLEEYGAEG